MAPKPRSDNTADTSSFNRYLRRRGYKAPWETANALHRWFLLSLTQPGFGNFWRVWNPVFGYYLLGLYRRLGGDDRRSVACLVTFGTCGFLHDLFAFIFLGEDFCLKVTIAFCIYAAMAMATSGYGSLRFLRGLPWYVHVVLNASLLVLGFLGAHVIWTRISATFT